MKRAFIAVFANLLFFLLLLQVSLTAFEASWSRSLALSKLDSVLLVSSASTDFEQAVHQVLQNTRASPEEKPAIVAARLVELEERFTNEYSTLGFSVTAWAGVSTGLEQRVLVRQMVEQKRSLACVGCVGINRAGEFVYSVNSTEAVVSSKAFGGEHGFGVATIGCSIYFNGVSGVCGVRE